MIYVQINNNNCYKIPPKESLLLQNINPIIPSTRSFPESTTSIQSSGYWTTPNTPPKNPNSSPISLVLILIYVRSRTRTLIDFQSRVTVRSGALQHSQFP